MTFLLKIVKNSGTGAKIRYAKAYIKIFRFCLILLDFTHCQTYCPGLQQESKFSLPVKFAKY